MSSRTNTNTHTGASVLVECLKRQDVKRVFCVPGESYLAVLDSLYEARDAIALTVCRQEGGAATMAEAYGKLTGKPGVCFVTRGPGATNASIGVHTAFQDSTPMVLLIGQVARDIRDREGFQEVDFSAMFRPLAKWAAQIDDPARMPEYIHRAFQTALAGRPGPVVLALPEDMLSEAVAGDIEVGLPAYPLAASPAPADLQRYADLLARAERPLMILGGGGWSVRARADLLAHLEAAKLPVCASLRCQDYIPNTHPLYAGHFGIGAEPALAQRLAESDLVIALGARLGEMTTGGYTLLRAPRPGKPLIHSYPDPQELGRVYQADLPIVASSASMAAALRALPVDARAAARRKGWAQALRAEYEASQMPPAISAAVDLAAIFQHLQARLPADTIITNGAGNYAGWLHKYWRFTEFRSQLAPTSGAMGYSVPAAVAAKLTYPERCVVSVNGDGCFLMNAQEIATAVQYGAAIVVLVINNSAYGTIRMHQEREYPARVWGTELRNPDFAALARSYGLTGERVTTTAQFTPALERALASAVGGLIEIVIDIEQLSVRTTLSKLRGTQASQSGAEHISG